MDSDAYFPDASLGTLSRLAIRLAVTGSREEENLFREKLRQQHVESAAVDFGGQFPQVVSTVLEHMVVAARRQFVISSREEDYQAVVEAVFDALSSLSLRANGMNAGGKAAIVRGKHFVCAAVFAEIGLLHLSTVGVGVSHRRIQEILPED
jgi:hypothetical protein